MDERRFVIFEKGELDFSLPCREVDAREMFDKALEYVKDHLTYDVPEAGDVLVTSRGLRFAPMNVGHKRVIWRDRIDNFDDSDDPEDWIGGVM